MMNGITSACSGMGDSGWLGLSLGSFLSFGFWLAVIWGAVALYRRLTGGRDPEAILARRFAGGEIDEEEYRRRLDAIRSRPDTADRMNR